MCYLVSDNLAGGRKNFLVEREEAMQPVPYHKCAVV